MTKEKIPDMSGFQAKLEEAQKNMAEKVMPMFAKMSEESAKLTKPQKRRNLTIDKQNCVISLIVDGRVIINFATIDEGEIFYNNFIDFTESKSKWWYKLFNVFKRK